MSFSAHEPTRKAYQKRPHAPWAVTRTRARLNALSRTMGSAMSVSLAHGMRNFKTRINPGKVWDAWISRDYSKIMEVIPWENFHADLEPGMAKSEAAAKGAWEAAFHELPNNKDPMLRWDTSNPRIRTFIASRKAHNFTNLTQSSATNIQGWVTRSMDRALSPRQVASGIRSQIGLLPAHAVAVDRYRANMAAAGNPSADRLADAYADRLLDYRAMMIARTETRLATNQGQLTVWRQAADHGLVDRHTTGRRWITAGPDPCEDCEAMDGRTVPLDSPWIFEDGRAIDCPPEGTHPHCFCTFDIVYDLDPQDLDGE